ncbi:MAG TPA: WG repeat-containing protein [Saprospiraceae bacterium]|nr:WG repeat-containing protein [Saprospiraceae bacterium]HPI07247.1 WG repeat-containing protein [Saprospiraceae bacterium]
MNKHSFLIALFIAVSILPVTGQDSIKWIFKPEFDALEWCGDGLIKTKKYNLCGLADTSGRTILEPVYKDIGAFSGQRAAVMLNRKYGFINKKGDLVVPVKYDFVKTYSENKAACKENGQYGFIDTQGKILIKPAFREAENFREGLAAVMDANRKWGYIDTLGNLVIPFKYDEADEFSSGTAKVRLDSIISYITYETAYYKGMTPEQKKKAEETSQKKAYTANAFGLSNGRGKGSGAPPAKSAQYKASKTADKWGIMHRKSSTWVIEPQFDDVDILAESLAKVKINGYWGLIRIR